MLQGRRKRQALLGGASSGTRHTGRAREYRPKKNLDAGAPLGLARPFLDCEKKGLASVRGTRSHDAAGQHRLTIQPGEWSGARCPRLRPARSLRLSQLGSLPSSARVSREHARSTADKAGSRDLSHQPAASQEKPATNLNVPLNRNEIGLRYPVRIG